VKLNFTRDYLSAIFWCNPEILIIHFWEQQRKRIVVAALTSFTDSLQSGPPGFPSSDSDWFLVVVLLED